MRIRSRRRRFNDLEGSGLRVEPCVQRQDHGPAGDALHPLAPDSTVVLPAARAIGAWANGREIETEWSCATSSSCAGAAGRAQQNATTARSGTWAVHDQYGGRSIRWCRRGSPTRVRQLGVQLDVPEDQVLGATGVPVARRGSRLSGANQDSRGRSTAAEAYPGITCR